MQYIHIRSLEKYHPGYKDRTLQWAKIHFKMVQGDPDCELINNEIDWARLIKMILLELSAQKPLPNIDSYWLKKGFDIKKRPMSLTLQMLHNFIQVDTLDEKLCHLDKDKEEDKDKEKEREVTHPPFVFLKDTELKTLTDTYGQSVIKDYIVRLNDYGGQFPFKFRKYHNHAAALRNWLRRDNVKKLEKPKEPEKPKEELRYDPRVAEMIKATAKGMK